MSDDFFYYYGYCDCLCVCFMEVGGDVVLDYEFLEFVFFCFILCWDVKFIVKELIKCFGIFVEVLVVFLVWFMEVDGIGESVVMDLKIVEVFVRWFVKGVVVKWFVLFFWIFVIDYCCIVMVFMDKE